MSYRALVGTEQVSIEGSRWAWLPDTELLVSSGLIRHLQQGLNIMGIISSESNVDIQGIVFICEVSHITMLKTRHYFYLWDSPCSSVGKESTCSAGDRGPIPGLGRSPGEGIGYPLQCSCLEDPKDRGPDGYSPWGHKSQTGLSD